MSVQPFERYPALASWIERMANTGTSLSLGEWMVFLGALNHALTTAERTPTDQPAIAPAGVVEAAVNLANVAAQSEAIAAVRDFIDAPASYASGFTPEEIGIAREEIQERIDRLEWDGAGAESQGYSTEYHDRRISILKRALASISPRGEGVEPVAALTTIMDWYGTLPKGAREKLSLANLHALSKALAAPADPRPAGDEQEGR